MSHITKLKTKIQDREYLLKALDSLGIIYRIGPEIITSFYGERRLAEIILPTKNEKYSIGLVKNGDTYELIADWFGIKEFTAEELLGKIAQRYSYMVVTEKLAESGFEITSQDIDAQNQIRITLKR
ncbi:MAG: hypothetical protein BWY58_00064 [Chloroflexi bacterium ADurb.Bin344]|nr:MAG: hypothetical protein BWY58_00064 [Chloroflexi bacterium ADurb.Bin344]